MGMELEFRQLDLRYESLRLRRPAAEKRLLASLAASGQLMPIVVVAAAEPERFTVVDGYKRVRALRQLRSDLVGATCWDLPELEALFMDRLLRSRVSETALEQGWVLREMVQRFELPLEELARRFERSISWVSRRLALVRELPGEIQERVRRGEIVAHAAMKYFVPLARANPAQSQRLAEEIAGHGLSSRQVGAIYAAWRGSSLEARERIVASPLLFLRAQGELEPSPSEAICVSLLRDFDILAMVARRAAQRLEERPVAAMLPPDQEEIRRAFHGVCCNQIERLSRRVPKEGGGAGTGSPGHDSPTA